MFIDLALQAIDNDWFKCLPSYEQKISMGAPKTLGGEWLRPVPFPNFKVLS
jgi:hypothetical protein